MMDYLTPKATATLSVTTSSARVQIASEVSGRMAVRVTVPAGGSVAFVNFGGSTVEATVAAGHPILPGTSEIFALGSGQTYAAAITGSSTATAYFTVLV